MKITKIEAIPVRIPLREYFVFSQGATKAFEIVVIIIHTDSNVVGYGECVTSTSFRDESLESIKAIIDYKLGSILIGCNPFDVELIFEKMESQVSRNFQAKAGIDFALYDIQGRIKHMPVYQLLGGLYSEKILVDYTLSAANNNEIIAKAKKMINMGYQTLVVKLKGNVKKDFERFKLVREAVGWDINIRADANQVYSPEKAIKIINKLVRYEPEFVEQPVKRWDLKGMAKVTQSVDVPISADESNVSIHDAMSIIQMGAADILNIKVPKNGGLFLSKKIASIAEAAGVPCIVGGMMTLEIARQASRHFAACTKQVNRGYASEGCGPASQELMDNITKNVITYNDVTKSNGYVHVSHSPGLGININLEKTNKYKITF